jgi:hypothetical protein
MRLSQLHLENKFYADLFCFKMGQKKTALAHLFVPSAPAEADVRKAFLLRFEPSRSDAGAACSHGGEAGPGEAPRLRPQR